MFPSQASNLLLKGFSVCCWDQHFWVNFVKKQNICKTIITIKQNKVETEEKVLDSHLFISLRQGLAR